MLFWGRTWMPLWPFSSKNDLKKSFWKNIHFSEASLPSVRSSIHPILWILHGAKSVVRDGIERVLPPKQQWRPLPSLLSVWSWMYSVHCVQHPPTWGGHGTHQEDIIQLQLIIIIDISLGLSILKNNVFFYIKLRISTVCLWFKTNIVMSGRF